MEYKEGYKDDAGDNLLDKAQKVMSDLPYAEKPSLRIQTSTPRPHKTAWLDGLRGVAALLVTVHHFRYAFYKFLERPYDGNANLHWSQRPFLRTFMLGGDFMVAIFYVVSGYVLAYRPLLLMRQGRIAETSEALISSTFRRFPRLYILPFVTCVIGVFITYSGLYRCTEHLRDTITLYGIPPPQQISLWRQFWHMWTHFQELFNILARETQYTIINYHLWTIPIEFKSSLMLFISLLGLSRCQPRFRLMTEVVLFYYGVKMRYYWEPALFIAGAFIAEVNMIQEDLQSGNDEQHDILEKRQQQQRSPSSSSSHSSLSLEAQSYASTISYKYLPPVIAELVHQLSTPFTIVLFLFSIYLGSTPSMTHMWSETGPYGFGTLCKISNNWYNGPGVDNGRFWHVIGAVCLLWSCTQSPALLQAIFNTSVCQYLGKISFSLYVCHGPILRTVGFISAMWTWTTLGRMGNYRVKNPQTPGYDSGMYVAAVTYWAASFAAAHMLTIYVDVPSVKLCKKLEKAAMKTSLRSD